MVEDGVQVYHFDQYGRRTTPHAGTDTLPIAGVGSVRV